MRATFSVRTLPRRRLDEGFTLIELLVVISLIMILSSIALASYRNSITSAKEAALRTDLFMMRDAIDQYYADKGKYPDSLETLVSEGYMRTIPVDPFCPNNSCTWTTTPAPTLPGATNADPGIYDVKSGSNAVALDSSHYSDW
jgi:general secretion pathway protein G